MRLLPRSFRAPSGSIRRILHFSCQPHELDDKETYAAYTADLQRQLQLRYEAEDRLEQMQAELKAMEARMKKAEAFPHENG